MIIATAGHVDHGKTLLVRALTGVDTDRLPEEKKRGLTIELGFAYHDLGDGETTGFIDVPGHERFIRTMVAGVAGIDLVLFIIAADDGPMPQTAEHLAILDLLGVSRGVIALTKIDRVDDERLAAVTVECETLIANSSLAGAPVIPVSALEGRGIDALRAALLGIGNGVEPRPLNGNFRLAIDRSFVLKGAGRVVTGTVFSGQVDVDDTVLHVPGDGELRVRGIHAQNAAASRAHAGQRTALNLTGPGLREGNLSRGDWITAGAAAFATRRFDAEIGVLPGEARALKNRTPVHVHIGAADVTGRLVTFDGKAIEPGQSAAAQLLLSADLHTVRGDRVVLRDQGARRTIGGGVVIDPLPDVRGRRRQERRAHFEAMRASTASASLTQALAAAPMGVDLARFQRGWNRTDDEAKQLFEQADIETVTAGDVRRGFERARWQALAAKVVPALEACHAAAPDRPGATPDEVARQVPEKLGPGLIDLLLEQLLAVGTIEREGAVVRLPGHRVQRDPRDEKLWARVEPLLDREDLKVPVVHDMLGPLKLELKLLEAFLNRSAQQGYLVKVSNKRYFLPQAMQRFEAMVRELAADQPDGVFSVADFRNRAGIGRNAVVEILEHFDRVGLTRRHGQVRKLIKQERTAS